MGEISDEPADTEGRTVDQRMSEHRCLLAMERRRLAIEFLASETPPTDLEALATRIAAHEREHGASESLLVEHITATLHHVHLPKLAEVGVVDYDPETHRIDPETPFLASYRLR